MPWLVALIAGIWPTVQRKAGTTQLPTTVVPEKVMTSAKVATVPSVVLTRRLGETADDAGRDAESVSPMMLHWKPAAMSDHRESAAVDVELHGIEHGLGHIRRFRDGLRFQREIECHHLD